MDAIFERFLADARGDVVKSAVKELVRGAGDPALREAFGREIQTLLREDPEIRQAIKTRLLRLITPVDTDQVVAAAAAIFSAARRGTGTDYRAAVAALCGLVGVAPPPPTADLAEPGGGSR